MTRPFSILVPAEEVMQRDYRELGDIVWTRPPASGNCIEYDIMYAAAGLTVAGCAGRTSMGTQLIGKVDLANGEQVFVVAWEHGLDAKARAEMARLRSVRVFDAAGDPMTSIGLLAFGVEEGGVGVFLDLTPG